MAYDLEELVSIYNKICDECQRKQEGITIRELKKNFIPRKRDLPILLNFFYTFSYFVDEHDMDFTIEDINGEDIFVETEINTIKDVEKAVTEITEHLNDQCKVYITNKISIPHRKFQQEDFMLGNITLEEMLDSTLHKDMEKISNKKRSFFLVDKNKTEKRLLEKKKKWVKSVLEGKLVTLWLKCGGKTEKMLEEVQPLGMYYNKFLDLYYCIYKENNVIKNTTLNEINNMKESQNNIVMESDEFDINDYMYSEQSEQLVFRVYKEGNVLKKLSVLLVDNQLIQEDKGEYVRFTIQVEDVCCYVEKLKQYGKSVIIENKDMVEDILSEIEELLEFY